MFAMHMLIIIIGTDAATIFLLAHNLFTMELRF